MKISTKWLIGVGLFLALLYQPAITYASICEVVTAEQFQDAIAKIKTNPKLCVDEKGMPTIDLHITDAENYLRWRITGPILVDTRVRITSSGRQAIIADFGGIQTCMMDVKDSDGVVIDNIIFLNNKSELNNTNKNLLIASNAVCIWDTAKNVTFKDNKIIGGDSVGMLVFNSATITNNRIKIGDGVGIFLMGSNNTVLNNTIDALPTTSAQFGIGIFVSGQDALISGNKIYALKSVIFPDNPVLKRSDAANIVQTNPSLLYDKTGEYDEELLAGNNFTAAYAKFCAGYGCTGDLIYCGGVPYGTAPYVAHEDGLICVKPPEPKKDAPTCPAAKIDCPLGGKVENGVCIVEKIIEKPVPGEAVMPPAGPFSPIIAQPQSDSSCSLVPNQAMSALAPVGIFLLTITLTGFTAYRSSLKTQRVRGKKE